MPDNGRERPRFCSQCGHPVTVIDANFCKECGVALATTVWLHNQISWRPLLALAFSLVPGLGHFYKGQPWRALVWFVGVTFMYASAVPLGLLLHLICAGNAALAGAIREEALTASSRSPLSRGFSAARPRS